MQFIFWGIQYLEEVMKVSIIAYGILKTSKVGKIKFVTVGILGFLMAVILQITKLQFTMGPAILAGIIIFLLLNIKGGKEKILVLIWYLGVNIIDSMLAGIVIAIWGWDINQLFENYTIDIMLNGVMIIILGVIWKTQAVIQKKANTISCSYKIVTRKQIIVTMLGMAGIIMYLVPIQIWVLDAQQGTSRIIEIMEVTVCSGILLGITIGLLIAENQKTYYCMMNDMSEKLRMQEQQYYVEKIKQEEETKKFRHDIKHHFSTMKHLLEEGEYTAASEYLESLIGKIEYPTYYINTGNALVDIVATDAMAETEHICLDWSGKLPQNIQMKDIDICILFSNLLSNAIEAVKAVDEPHIKVEIKHGNSQIMIHIANPIKQTMKVRDQKFITTKSDKTRHGFGSENIADVVNKYHGDIHYDYTNQNFEVRILIPY